MCNCQCQPTRSSFQPYSQRSIFHSHIHHKSPWIIHWTYTADIFRPTQQFCLTTISTSEGENEGFQILSNIPVMLCNILAKKWSAIDKNSSSHVQGDIKISDHSITAIQWQMARWTPHFNNSLLMQGEENSSMIVL